jgi:hypothetical protein
MFFAEWSSSGHGSGLLFATIYVVTRAQNTATCYGRGIGRGNSYRGHGLCDQSRRLPSDHAKSGSCDVVPKNCPTQGSSALKANIGVTFFPRSFIQKIKLLHRKVGFPSLDDTLYYEAVFVCSRVPCNLEGATFNSLLKGKSSITNPRLAQIAFVTFPLLILTDSSQHFFEFKRRIVISFPSAIQFLKTTIQSLIVMFPAKWLAFEKLE